VAPPVFAASMDIYPLSTGKKPFGPADAVLSGFAFQPAFINIDPGLGRWRAIKDETGHYWEETLSL